jgi:hypothetical protein
MRYVAVVVGLVAVLSAASTADGRGSLVSRRCPSFHIGPAYYSSIATEGVRCPVARRLLDRTMLSSIRQGRVSWSYGGYRWRFRPVDEVSARIVGRKGERLIRARFAVA